MHDPNGLFWQLRDLARIVVRILVGLIALRASLWFPPASRPRTRWPVLSTIVVIAMLVQVVYRSVWFALRWYVPLPSISHAPDLHLVVDLIVWSLLIHRTLGLPRTQSAFHGAVTVLLIGIGEGLVQSLWQP